jgi:hypothetical protein
MPNLLVWAVGNRNPSITETITIDGVAVDLTASTVTFRARALGASALLVDAAATVVSAPAGTVRYDWTAADASTGLLSASRFALVWWQVTTSGKTQDVGEAVIEVRAHAPITAAYLELEELRATLGISATTHADPDVRAAINAASRAVDLECNRRFYKDTADATRYYTPESPAYCRIDDLADLTSVKLDADADGTYETTLTENTDFVFFPLNAETDGVPRTAIRTHTRSSTWLRDWPRSVQVVGKFGWDTVPPQVVEATSILAGRLLKRSREAPMGVVALGVDGVAVRISRTDPDVAALLAPLVRLPV